MPPNPNHGPNDPLLDLVFCLDCTGSMGPYIEQAKRDIEEIARRVFASKLLADSDDLRVGLVAYRDYRPQDFQEFEKKSFPFTSNMADIQRYLSGLKALGGGDGPEAVATAVYEAVTKMAWRRTGARVIVIITDAPPHGLGASGATDGFPKGDPHPTKPDFSAPKLSALFNKGGEGEGIHVLTVMCEPTLSTYKLASTFYKGLAKKTAGRSLPLGSAEVLADSIVVFALETLKLGSILHKLGGKAIAEPGHANAKFHTLFRAVTGHQLSDAESDQQLQRLYEDMPEDLEEQIALVTTKRTPEEAISELRTHLKGELCHQCTTNVSHKLSAEGRHNMELFMKATPSGLSGTLKEDNGTKLVGDPSKQTISIKEGSLSDGQIKRLSHLYVSRYGLGPDVTIFK